MPSEIVAIRLVSCETPTSYGTPCVHNALDLPLARCVRHDSIGEVGKTKKQNPHCPVSGCQTAAPHLDDPTVQALMLEFAPPGKMCKWTLAAMAELGESICRDLESKKVFAFHTRVRQPEELYIRTLYVLFIAPDAELPHIMSGATPNGMAQLYREVNRVVFGGRGLLLEKHPGLTFGTFAPIDTLHDGAHVSFRSFLTCIGWVHNPQAMPKPEDYRRHLKTYCNYLNYMCGMFEAGKAKQHVLVGVRNLHRPASHWRSGEPA
jgi:hypothetical protein